MDNIYFSELSMAKKRRKIKWKYCVKGQRNSVAAVNGVTATSCNNRLTIQKEYIILANRGKRKERHL